MTYRTIMADPPWYERGAGHYQRGADRHYPIMKTPDIIDTMRSCPMFLPDESCHLWLWVTNTFLPDGLLVMKELGFRYITNLCWTKQSIGIGQYLRGMHELCLFGARGKAMLPPVRNVPSVVVHANKTLHSVKPQAVVSYIERVSPAPRLEMFARSPRPGWHVWGNECDGNAIDTAQLSLMIKEQP